MRRIVLLAGILTATPAIASDCPPEQEDASFQLDSLRIVWQQLQTIMRTGSISNGLGLGQRDQARGKTPHTVQPTRDSQCGPSGQAPVGDDLLDHLYE